MSACFIGTDSFTVLEIWCIAMKTGESAGIIRNFFRLRFWLGIRNKFGSTVIRSWCCCWGRLCSFNGHFCSGCSNRCHWNRYYSKFKNNCHLTSPVLLIDLYFLKIFFYTSNACKKINKIQNASHTFCCSNFVCFRRSGYIIISSIWTLLLFIFLLILVSLRNKLKKFPEYVFKVIPIQ